MPVPDYDQRQSKGYRIFLSGIKGVIRILILVFLIVIAIFLVRSAYSVGYDVTAAGPLNSEADAVETMVVIDKDMSVKDIADLLNSKGLIREEAYAFVIQEMISDHHDEIIPGTYVLSSAMSVEEMIAVMSRADKDQEDDDQS